MVKVGLNIKNGSKVFKPKQGDVIIFDGKDWYVTTKEDLFREYDQKFTQKLEELNEKVEEMQEFKEEISDKMIEMAGIIKDFINFQGKGDN